MDACSLRVPRQVHVAGSGQSWQLHGLANAHQTQCPEVLPRNYGDGKGAHEPDAKERAIHQT